MTSARNSSPHEGQSPLPRAEGLARSLEEARPGQVLCLGPRGQVQRPHLRIAIAGLWGLVLGLGAAVVTSMLFGANGLLVALVIATGYWILQQRAVSSLREAHVRFARDDLAKAQVLARRASTAILARSLVRGNALSLAAACAWLQGNLTEAHALFGRAGVVLEASLARDARAHLVLAILQEVQLIALTEGHDAADHRLAELDARNFAADGDLVAAQRIDTELVLAFEADDPSRLPDDLDPWTQMIVRTNRFGSTLLLLAWALRARGETELADALLDTAEDRLPECHIDKAHPRLHAWHQEVRP